MTPRARRTAASALVLLGLVACERAEAPSPLPESAPGPAERFILIGLDGASWPMLDALIGAGRMPWLARIVASGSSAVLWSEEPTVSPALWTTLLTGRSREAHGIHGFTGRDPHSGSVAPARSSMRRVPALWTYLNHLGKTTGIVGAHVTWPAEPVDGFVVSRRVSEPGFSYATYPPELAQRAGTGDLEHFESLLLEDHFLDASFPDHRYGFMRQTWLADNVAFDLGLDEATRVRPDFLFVYFHLTDSVQHVFWPPRATPAPVWEFEPIARVYEYVDRRLAELFERVWTERTALMVVSDHGAAGTGIAVLFERHTDELLAALGYLTFRSAGEIDRQRSLLVPGPASGDEVRFWVNRENPELAGSADRRAQLAERALARLRSLGLERAGRPLFSRVTPSPDDPDVLVAQIGLRSLEDAADHVDLGGRRVRLGDLYRPAPFGGGHTLDGVLVAVGPPFRSRERHVPEGPRPTRPPASGALGIRDVAPTVLAAMGLPVPQVMEGRVMQEILRPAFLAEHPIERRALDLDWQPFEPEGLGSQAQEPDEMLKMLQALGYAQ